MSSEADGLNSAIEHVSVTDEFMVLRKPVDIDVEALMSDRTWKNAARLLTRASMVHFGLQDALEELRREFVLKNSPLVGKETDDGKE